MKITKNFSLFFIWADLSEKVKTLENTLEAEKKQKKVDVEGIFI